MKSSLLSDGSPRTKRLFSNAQKLVYKDTLNLNKLCWTKRLTSPYFQIPLFITVSDVQYLITDFSSPADFALEANAASFEEGLLLSLEIYGANTVTLEEWLTLHKIAVEVNAILPYPKWLTERLALFLNAIPTVYVKYLSERKIPSPTLQLLSALEEGLAAEIFKLAVKEGFSSQRFKRLVEDSRDFGVLTLDRRSERHKELEKLLESVKINTGEGVSVNTPDFYESGALEVSFRVQNIEEYRRAVKGISRATEAVTEYFSKG